MRSGFCVIVIVGVISLGLGAIISAPEARGQAGGASARASSDNTTRDDAPRVDSRESFLSWMARASGPIGYVIALMSFYLVALVTWMAIYYRAQVAIPPTLEADLGDLLDQSRYQDAYNRLAGDSSPLGRVLMAAVRKLPSGLPKARRALELASEDAVMEMEHRTTYLATVGTLGPMIGLVGTVYGMIMAFRVIATEGSTPQASQLAAGISTALFATLEGIAISIPAIYFHSFFRNRIARLSLQVEMAAEPLLERFAPGIQRLGSGPGAGSPGAAHPHPFAVSAALAASSGAQGTSRPAALPPVDSPDA